MMKKIIAVAAFLLCTTAAQAGIVMGGTRVIYQEGKREAAISVTNADTHTPYLVQSVGWKITRKTIRPGCPSL
ncbi:chaperone protein fimC [Klebsiella pneumoniae subsp. rhinoscleromatis]|nr:chaperone protein fimC [Klebsiella pneumoniae subsp. rhinoscleromatis]